MAGHLRQIPLAWRASEASRRDAEASGVRLPEGGFTWVRPHSRGTGIEGEVPEVKRVRVSKKRRTE